MSYLYFLSGYAFANIKALKLLIFFAEDILEINDSLIKS